MLLIYVIIGIIIAYFIYRALLSDQDSCRKEGINPLLAAVIVGITYPIIILILFIWFIYSRVIKKL
jgi:hypothetical protein